MIRTDPIRAVIADLDGLLTDDRIHASKDAVAAFTRWHRGGLPLAAVSARRDGDDVLQAAGLRRCVDVVIDGRLAAGRHLSGRRGRLEEAARQLNVEPADAVVLDGDIAGIEQAREAGFGLIVGVARKRDGDELLRAGADTVVHDVNLATFPRRIPALLDHLDALDAWQGDRTPALFVDFDGTLSPIVDDPAAARLPEATKAELETLAGLCPVAVISGRDREDVAARVGIDSLLYAGNHGFDIAGRGHRKVLPEAERAAGRLADTAADLIRRLSGIEGVIIEHKRFSVAVHYRRVQAESLQERVIAEVGDVHRTSGLRLRSGKKVLELEPDLPWNKGHALRWLMRVMDLDPEQFFVIYIGDDVTDEDAFGALAGDGAGVLVGREVSSSLADWRVDEPDDVRRLLRRIRTRLTDR